MNEKRSKVSELLLSYTNDHELAVVHDWATNIELRRAETNPSMVGVRVVCSADL